MKILTIYLREGYTNNEGKMPIYLRVRISNQYVVLSLNIFVKPEFFDPQKQIVKKGVDNYDQLNMILTRAKSRANEIFIKYELSETKLTKELFKAEFLNESKGNDFYVFATEQLRLRKKHLAHGTWRHDSSFINILREFKPNLTFNDIDVRFITSFQIFLSVVHKNSIDTQGAILKILKTYLNIAVRENYIKENPFNEFQIKWEKKNPVFLDMDELNVLIHLYNSGKLTPSRQKVLRHYLFACIGGGMRISDLKRLTFDNIVSKRFLIFTPKKTSSSSAITVQIELPEPALKLIKDEGKISGTLFNMYEHDQITNRVIKEVFKIAEFKGKKLTFHSSRHTFAVIYLLLADNAMAFPTLSKILGHSTVQQTMDTYVGITSLMLSEGMRKFNQFQILGNPV